MKNKMAIVYLALCLVIGIVIVNQLFADSAEVLPKGVTTGRMDGKFYLPIDQRYSHDGHPESAAADLNANLNSSVFPALGLVEQFFGMPPGSASIGQSVVTFQYNYKIVELFFGRGITDRLSVGILLPYWWVSNDVTAALNTVRATVGKNAALNTIAPLSVPGTVPLTTKDAQNLIGRGLDINGDGKIDIPGFGFKPVKNWSNHGLSDIEVGAKYQYLKTDNWRLAFTGEVRCPTGEIDDRNNLVDRGLGQGAWALLFRFQNDYIGFKNLTLNGTFRYDLIFPDQKTLRIPEAVNQPLTRNVETVDRNLGDVFEFEGTGTYTLTKGLDFYLTYKYGFSLKDSVKGRRGHIESLEDETNYSEQVFITGLSYSTIPLFLEKKFPLPITASISYRNRFAGTNKVLKSQYIDVGLQIYF